MLNMFYFLDYSKLILIFANSFNDDNNNLL